MDNHVMQWDIFCRVIDNFGDIGVCWRLSSDLAARGHQVRLWADDTSALEWMAPGALAGRQPGVQVLSWDQSKSAPLLSTLTPADIWIESFGCEIAPEFIAFYAIQTGAEGQKGFRVPTWINLEYLTAEAFADRAHGLPSPVMHGPATGWIKHFFYPGFSAGTGGLLRERDLLPRMSNFDTQRWIVDQGIDSQPGERLISVFCYEPFALNQLLTDLAAGSQPTRLLVTAGRAAATVLSNISHKNRLEPLWNKRETLSFSYLPALSQPDFDHLLWACDLNFVRGEDSVVRALWAGKPFVWQIYPQADDAHRAKLNAFLDMLGANSSLRQTHHLWNGISAQPSTTLSLDDSGVWGHTVQSCRRRLLQLDDLSKKLVQFAQKNGKI